MDHCQPGGSGRPVHAAFHPGQFPAGENREARALVYQSPGFSRTLPPLPTLGRALLIAAVSAAPVVSPEGARTLTEDIAQLFSSGLIMITEVGSW